jgi:hypothetical protein
MSTATGINWLGTAGNTSSGATPGYYGLVTITGSNTTITNGNVSANSIILCQAYATPGAGPPLITSRTTGSFVVNITSPGAGSIAYYILQS